MTVLTRNSPDDVVKLEIARLKDHEDHIKGRLNKFVEFAKDLKRRNGHKLIDEGSGGSHDRLAQVTENIARLRVSLDQVRQRRIATESKLKSDLEGPTRVEPEIEKVRRFRTSLNEFQKASQAFITSLGEASASGRILGMTLARCLQLLDKEIQETLLELQRAAEKAQTHIRSNEDRNHS